MEINLSELNALPDVTIRLKSNEAKLLRKFFAKIGWEDIRKINPEINQEEAIELENKVIYPVFDYLDDRKEKGY